MLDARGGREGGGEGGGALGGGGDADADGDEGGGGGEDAEGPVWGGVGAVDGGDGEVCAVAVVGGQGWGFGVVVPVDCREQDRCAGSRKMMQRIGYRSFGSVQGLQRPRLELYPRKVHNPLVGSLQLVGNDPQTLKTSTRFATQFKPLPPHPPCLFVWPSRYKRKCSGMGRLKFNPIY